MIKDSGARREFSTGAVRDIADGVGKGRCDLLPLVIIGKTFNNNILLAIGHYIEGGDKRFIQDVIRSFILDTYANPNTAVLELAKHYEEGCLKYGDRNWEKGIPLHCYIDSGVRHYLKYLRGDQDEPHDRAFMWNMFGALWTQENHPELIDLPFKEKLNERDKVD